MTRPAADRPDRSGHWARHLALLLAVAGSLYPVLWVAALAFSGRQDMALAQLPAEPGALDRLRAVLPLPERWSLDNFAEVLTQAPLLRWLWNSLVVSTLTTVVGVSLACSAAYAFSRFRFAGRLSGMTLFLVSQMYPAAMMLIPLYIIVVEWMNLGDTYAGLVLVYTVTALPFSVWMLKSYFDTIPIEIEESAIMDGASRTRVFLTIVLPLATPAVVITALFSFMTAWNEFILAAVFMESETAYTAPVGLRFFVADYTSQWGYFAAGALLVSIPVAALFFVLQRWLVSGLTAGGVKG